MEKCFRKSTNVKHMQVEFCVVWDRCDVYGLKVVYLDAFEECLSIHEINTLLDQQKKVQAEKSQTFHAGLSTRGVERCAGVWVQEPMILDTDM